MTMQQMKGWFLRLVMMGSMGLGTAYLGALPAQDANPPTLPAAAPIQEILGGAPEAFWTVGANAAAGLGAATAPETHLPEPVPPEQELASPLPDPKQPLGEPQEAQVSAPPKAPRQGEPALPPAPEPSLSRIVSETAPPTAALPPAGASEPVLPPLLEPSVPDMAPAPSVSVPPSLPPADYSIATLPKPAPPPEGSLSSSSSRITLRPVAPPQGAVPPPVQTPVAPPPEPPRFIRPAEPESPPPLSRQPPPRPVNPIVSPAELSPNVVIQVTEVQARTAYSRTVQATVGQLVEIPFRGTGWVYLGEQESRPGMVYDSRRMEKEGQNFLFKTEQAGTYTLKFYKQDFIQDYLINDYVQVIVNPASPVARTNQTLRPIDQGRVIAGPRWPPLAGEAEANRDPADSAPQPPPEAIPLEAPQPPSPASSPPIDYVQQAREAYAAGQFPQALSFLDQFREQYPAGTDEAWWLYGQSLEALSPSRDIRSALDYYRRLIREYPQSLRGNEARRRIAYLERYYFTIQ